MSKSKLNGVPPDTIIVEYGADALRLYEMFMGPFDKEKLWDTAAISGCRRFLDRFYALVHSDKVEENGQGLDLAHRLAFGVQKDIEEMSFNTAIAKMMEFVNAFSKLSSYSQRGLEMATQALAPFAPHLAEECWKRLGHQESITFIPYPTIDPQHLMEESVTYVIQINGKFRGKWSLPKGQTKEGLLERAQREEKIEKWMKGEIKKVVFVPEKLLNIVMET